MGKTFEILPDVMRSAPFVRTVAKPCQNSLRWCHWGLALSKKRISQIVETIRSMEN